MKNFYPVEIDARSVSVANGAAAPDVVQIGNNFPAGILISELWVTIEGTLALTETAPGTVADVSSLVKSIQFRTDKHGDIIEPLDGLSLKRVLNVLNHTAVPATQVTTGTGNKTFRITYKIPFGFFNDQIRPADSFVDLAKALPLLRVSLGDPTSLVSGGTYTNRSYTATVRCAVVAADPAGDGGNFPGLMPLFSKKVFDLTSTGNQLPFELTFGDRIVKAYIIQQLRDGVEVADILSGKIAVQINNRDMAVLPVDVNQLRDAMQQRFEMESMPTGLTPLDFNQSGKLTDQLNLIQQTTGSAKMLADVTLGGGTTRQLNVITIGFRQIPDVAKRDVAAAA